MHLLENVENEGLRREDYYFESLKLYLEQFHIFRVYKDAVDPTLQGRIDILLSNAFLRYVADLTGGRIKASEVYPRDWRTEEKTINAVEVLRVSLLYGTVAETLRGLAPNDPGYRRLCDYLGYFRQLAAAGGWPQLPEGYPLRPGQSDWRIPWLQDRLIKSGDLKPENRTTEWIYDESSVAALQRFQQRHGLEADGVLGPKTLAALNFSVEERIRQIEMNLERRRWLPRYLGNRYLLVNIPDFQLEVVEDNLPVMTMPVVVGKDERRTPVFSSRLRYLDFAPYWNVPPTILREDKLPLIKADLNYLATHHFEIVDFKRNSDEFVQPQAIDWERVTAENFPGMLRQKPGPWNPLGRVKFMFPNKFHVYMHDTPEKYLFELKKRTFSSGCIRLKKPLELARYLLQGEDGWYFEKVAEAMASPEPLRVLLRESLPVHIVYRTVWVGLDGRLQFRPDIYELDPVLYTALRSHNRKRASLVACQSGSTQQISSLH